ncbi:TonB-dependent receptor domain-containing protein [Terrimonas ferruginea]|uniref:TonB-dependent receptor domain-containing protein n=1 Tax=Terrimonas ferruginea TaxID=249 RepID=UPI0004907B32|nr:TonB-dependent receptor [Terrimonas ferruginea]
MRRIVCWLIIFSFVDVLHAQQADTDSVQALERVQVKAYTGRQVLFRTPGAAAVITQQQLIANGPAGLLPSLNQVAGVRMEERSPGSYRLAIRGSQLRSPFGVRNIKVYLDEYPLTDAGGNTYFNIFNPGDLARIELLKGPDGSLFGANSGGVLRLQAIDPDTAFQLKAGIGGGSYGLFMQEAEAGSRNGAHTWNVRESWQQSDGYRENSRLRRGMIRIGDHWQYHNKGSIELLALIANTGYRTPGGLTAAQFAADPRQARPAAAQLPGAVTQKAGIYSDYWLTGITHTWKTERGPEYVTAFSYAGMNLRNPFITNYETRKERTFSLRTFLRWSIDKAVRLQSSFTLGAEGQQTFSFIRNYTNESGDRGERMLADDIRSQQYFLFGRGQLQTGRWQAEAALSLNQQRHRFTGDQPLLRLFRPQWMPRVAASFLLYKNVLVRGSVGRGYSPPSLGELRPSGNVVDAGLQPESGWNKEIGLRWQDGQRHWWMDVSAFHYGLNETIVRRLTDAAEEYFINAGNTRQQGLEWQGSWDVLRSYNHRGWRLQLNGSAAFYHFRFRDYKTDATDYTGKKIAGIPGQQFTLATTIGLRQTSLNVSWFYTGTMPLNDANTVLAKTSHLVRVQFSQLICNGKNGRLECYAGGDNLLNQRYSLGYDLNAPGGRFYNAAAPRNWFAGIRWGLIQNSKT